VVPLLCTPCAHVATQALHSSNAVDFDDLLSLTVAVLRQNKQALIQARDRWRYIFVDEFQDTNAAQVRLHLGDICLPACKFLFHIRR
jgi:hypothetical protein